MAIRLEQGQARRVGSVRDVLEWAFGAECAQVDFGAGEGHAGGVDTIWIMMQRGAVGTQIDGGQHKGFGRVAHDADLVAGVVASLPVAYGGRSMALAVAEHARAARCPDPMIGARPRVVPVDWRGHKHGRHAVVASAAEAGINPAQRWDVRGRNICPVRLVPTAQAIAAARRFYLDWWGALWFLRAELRLAGLVRWDISDALPPRAPWREKTS